MFTRTVAGFIAIVSMALLPWRANAQALASTPPARAIEPSNITIHGPAPPAPPAVVARDAAGRVTLRATRLVEPLVIDGRLDEPAYERVPAVVGFIQQEPREGEPATEATEAWIFFDDRNLYVAARLLDSQPDRIVANEMRRDHWNISRGASFTVALDTFYDRRNGFIFQTNPLGAIRDAQVTDERNENLDWSTVWDAQTTRSADGWTVEMVIPFKSLRYQQGADQVWGLNLQRNIRWKNEQTFLSPIPASYGSGGINKFSSAATLVGIQPPQRAKDLELKPYAISSVTTDRTATPSVSNHVAGDVGFDVKYRLTRGMTADFTVNTDFAQVEADEEQVNLTRFSLSFPEKREFFLEGQGIFGFGGRENRVWGPGGDTPILFYSRRIGISQGAIVPIRAGARVTGRACKYTIGLLNMQTGESETVDAASTNFSVVRVRRDILRRSTISVIGTHRSVSLDGTGSNQVYGADANFAFFQNLNINTYYAQSRTPGRSGNDTSYRARIANRGDRYGFEYEHLLVGDNFNPEMGFLRRRDFRLNRGELRFSPRPTFTDVVRRFSYQVGLDHFTNGDGVVETRELEGRFQAEFQNSDQWGFAYQSSYEFLDEPFFIASDVTIPVGAYDFQYLRTSYRLGSQRKVSGWLSFGRGGLFDGTRTESSFQGRVEVTPQLSLEPQLSVDWVNLPAGAFTSTLLGSRVTYTMSSRMFVSALVQYHSSRDALSTNVRFRWEYQPGSDLFIVYSEGREINSLRPSFSTLQNRGLAIKLTRLLRF